MLLRKVHVKSNSNSLNHKRPQTHTVEALYKAVDLTHFLTKPCDRRPVLRSVCVFREVKRRPENKTQTLHYSVCSVEAPEDSRLRRPVFPPREFWDSGMNNNQRSANLRVQAEDDSVTVLADRRYSKSHDIRLVQNKLCHMYTTIQKI